MLRGKKDAFIHSGTRLQFFRGRTGKVAIWIRIHAGDGPDGADAHRRAIHPVQAGAGRASRSLVDTRASIANLLTLTLDADAHEDDVVAQLAVILEVDFYECLEASMGYYPPPPTMDRAATHGANAPGILRQLDGVGATS